MEQKGTLSKSDLRDFFREMLLIRRFEEKVEERFRAGELPGFLHVAIGQEAVAVGVCRALEENDIIASTHRAHGHTLAKGTTPNELMAELYGKLEGCSHGYGGSMHLYDIERGNMGANAVVGGGLPAIVGAALAFKFRSEPRVGVAFFGDGATNIGTFHESLNLAQLWKVPAVFVCENNHWAESTPGWQHMPIEDISQRAVAFGMKSIKVDGQDVEAVYKAARRASSTRGAARGRSSSRSTPTGSSVTTSATRRSTAPRKSSRRRVPRRIRSSISAPSSSFRGRGRRDRPGGPGDRRGLGGVREERHRPEA